MINLYRVAYPEAPSTTSTNYNWRQNKLVHIYDLDIKEIYDNNSDKQKRKKYYFKYLRTDWMTDSPFGILNDKDTFDKLKANIFSDWKALKNKDIYNVAQKKISKILFPATILIWGHEEIVQLWTEYILIKSIDEISKNLSEKIADNIKISNPSSFFISEEDAKNKLYWQYKPTPYINNEIASKLWALFIIMVFVLTFYKHIHTDFK